jgi:hypothetical protein
MTPELGGRNRDAQDNFKEIHGIYMVPVVSDEETWSTSTEATAIPMDFMDQEAA